jgi:hypothetical protein
LEVEDYPIISLFDKITCNLFLKDKYMNSYGGNIIKTIFYFIYNKSLNYNYSVFYFYIELEYNFDNDDFKNELMKI